jgi:hypothetical protein
MDTKTPAEADWAMTASVNAPSVNERVRRSDISVSRSAGGRSGGTQPDLSKRQRAQEKARLLSIRTRSHDGLNRDDRFRRQIRENRLDPQYESPSEKMIQVPGRDMAATSVHRIAGRSDHQRPILDQIFHRRCHILLKPGMIQ